MSDRIVFRVLPNSLEGEPSFVPADPAKPWKVTRRSWRTARPVAGGGEVTETGPARPLGAFRWRWQAILFARRQALAVFDAGGRSQVVIHRRDGKIAREWTYRDDPRDSWG